MHAWRLIAENKIQTAIDAGEFDELPGFGKPLADLDQPFSHASWLRQKAEKEQLNLLPPALQLKADVARKLDLLKLSKEEAKLRDALKALNEWIASSNRQILWGPPSNTMPVDVEAFIEGWKSEPRT